MSDYTPEELREARRIARKCYEDSEAAGEGAFGYTFRFLKAISLPDAPRPLIDLESSSRNGWGTILSAIQ